MADARLQVEIGTSLQQLTREMSRAEQVVQRGTTTMSNATTQTERSFTRLNSTRFTFGESYANASRTLATQAQRTSTALGGATASSNRAGQALVDLGRVAQDAPFGFVAIQNNLSPLLESFQRLRAEAGSNRAALSSLVGSLTGPAGIGIALSVVSAGVILYQQYQQRSKKATEEAAKANENYADSLDQVSSANLKGAQAAQKELTELKVLYSITQNTNLSYKQRKEAVDDLQRQYPSYFKNISDEKILAGGASDAYNALAQSIIATAKARASTELIQKNESKRLEIADRIARAEKEQLDIQREAQALSRSAGAYNPYGAGSTASSAAVLDAPRKIAEKQKEINGLRKQDNDLLSKNLVLTKNINAQVLNGADVSGAVGGEATEKKVKTISDVLKALSIDLKQVANDNTITFSEATTKRIDAYKKAVSEITEIGGGESEIKRLQSSIFGLNQELYKIDGAKFASNLEKIRIEADATQSIRDAAEEVENLNKAAAEGAQLQSFFFGDESGNKAFDKAVENYHRSLEEFRDGFKSIGSEAIAYAGTFFQSLGEAAASGDFSNFGEGILKAFAGFLGELGQMFIKQGVASIAYGSALMLNPLTAAAGPGYIASGLGQIAAGALISVGSGLLSGGRGGQGGAGDNNSYSPKRQFQGFASGTNFAPGGMSWVGERGPELVNLPKGSQVIPTHKIGNMGGGNVINLNGRLAVSAGELLFMLDKERNRQSRQG